MKRITAFFVFCLLLLMGCQPTPGVDAVKQKNTNQLIQAVKEAEQERDEPAPVPVKETVPARFQCDFVTETRQVRVTADVPIRVLTEGVFPLVRVRKRTLTNEERLTVYGRLFGSQTVDDVQLGLFRIREQGDMESGLLVPVWFITGEYRDASHPEDVHLYDSFTPIAVINAIDGSIIDVMNGY